jgi:hypothetical protein
MYITVALNVAYHKMDANLGTVQNSFKNKRDDDLRKKSDNVWTRIGKKGAK